MTEWLIGGGLQSEGILAPSDNNVTDVNIHCMIQIFVSTNIIASYFEYQRCTLCTNQCLPNHEINLGQHYIFKYTF